MDSMYCINMYVYYLEQICHYEKSVRSLTRHDT